MEDKTLKDSNDIVQDLKTAGKGCLCLIVMFLCIICYTSYHTYQKNRENKFISNIVVELENDDRYIELKQKYNNVRIKEWDYINKYGRINRLHEYIVAKLKIYDSGIKNAYDSGNAISINMFAHAKDNDIELSNAIKEYNTQRVYYDYYKQEHKKFKTEYVDEYKHRLNRYIKHVIDKNDVNIEYDSEKILTHVIDKLYIEYEKAANKNNETG